MTRKIKYFYKKKPLIEYCRENGINYLKVVNRILNLGCTEDEAINFQDKRGKGNPRYDYHIGDLTLAEYCRQQGYKCYCYNSAIKRCHNGMKPIDAVTKPLIRTRKKKNEK